MKKFFLAIGVFAISAMTVLPCFAANPVPAGVGVNIHFTGAPARDLDLIKNAGFNMARTDLKWDRVERSRGNYNWTEYDQLIDALIARGITPYMILDYNNPVYGAGAMDGIHTSDQRTGFTNFAKAAAARYKGKKIIWEIWNEPNLGSIFWRPVENVSDYMALIKSVCPAMRAADPNVVIVAPGVAFIANTFDFLHGCMAQGLLNYIDGLSVHPYKNENPEAGTVDYLYNSLKGMLRDYGHPDMPIVGGEFGFSTSWSNVKNETNQAQFLVRQLIMHDYYKVPVSIVYDFRNDGTDPNNAEHNFGTIRNDYSLKPAYNEIKKMRENLAGMTFKQKLSTGNNADHLYEYTGSKGSVVAAWTTGGSRSTNIYGKSVNLTNMPTYVWQASTTPPPSEPPTTDPPTTEPPTTEPPASSTAPKINNVKLAYNKTKGEYIVVVDWADNATTETGFEIFRSIGNTNNFESVKTINKALTNTSQTIKYRNNIGATPTNGTYYYKIVVKFADSTTLTSNTESVTVSVQTTEPPAPPAATVPALPTNIVGSVVKDINNNNVVLLNWTDASTNEDGFYIFSKSCEHATLTKVGTLSKDVTSVVHPVTLPGTYSYQIKSFNSAGEAANAPVTTVTVN